MGYNTRFSIEIYNTVLESPTRPLWPLGYRSPSRKSQPF